MVVKHFVRFFIIAKFLKILNKSENADMSNENYVKNIIIKLF